MRLAIPSFLTNLLRYVSTVINTIFSGHMQDEKMQAAVGLSNVCLTILISSILQGLNTTQETLTSQAYGNGNYRLCGNYFIRGSAILFVFFVPIALFATFFSEACLVALGEDPEVSRLAQIQIRLCLPGALFYGWYDLLKKWLACNRITHLTMIAMLINAILYAPLCMLFAEWYEMGIEGLAIA